MGMMRRLGLFALAIVLIVAGIAYYARGQQKKNAITMKTAKVERGEITTSVSGTGTLEPLTTVEVKSNVGGTLVYLGVDEGDMVQAGQVVARIDPADANSTLEQSQADLQSARAKVTQAQKNLLIQQEQFPAQVKSAEKAVVTARLHLNEAIKQATLQKTQTDTSLDQAQQGVDAAKARLAQAEEEAQLQPQLTDASINQAKSSLAAAQSAYQQTKNATVPQKISAAQTALDQAKANNTFAVNDLKRQRELLAKGFVARSAVESAEQRADVAKAQLESAQDKFDTVKAETNEDLASAQARVDQAQAALKTAEVNRAQDSLRNHDVVSARAALKQAEASLKAAEANRVQNSLKDDEVETARAALQQAEASLVTVKANSSQTAIKQGDIVQAEAQVKRSEASVTNAQTQVGYTTITAPRAGIVMKKYVEAGSIVAGGRTSLAGTGSGVTLMDIADVSRMNAIVNIDETDIAQISLGQEVNVSVDAYSDELFIGKVTRIAPMTVTDQNVTTIPVTVEIEAPDLRLKPGMNATCDFVTAHVTDVLTVPSTAIKHSGEDSVVTVIEKGKPIVRKVQTGLSDASMTEIREGLKAGDIVVTAMQDPRKDNNLPAGDQGGRSGGGRMRMRGPF